MRWRRLLRSLFEGVENLEVLAIAVFGTRSGIVFCRPGGSYSQTVANPQLIHPLRTCIGGLHETQLKTHGDDHKRIVY